MNDLLVATNELNAALVAAEEHLTRLDLGVTATVPLRATPKTLVGFGKLDQRWSLFIQGADGGCVLILRASRRERVAAAYEIGELERALYDQAAVESATVSSAAGCIRSFLNRNG